MATHEESGRSGAGPTRRDFLAAAALAGLGAAARFQDSKPRAVPARFVGDAFERGHHWTSNDPEKMHVERTEKKSVVIVGGGIAGIVAAWRLLEAGVDEFVVLELEDKPGGLARNGLIGKTVVPFGAVMMGLPGKGESAVTRVLDAGHLGRGGISWMPDSSTWSLVRFGARPEDVSPEAIFEDQSRFHGSGRVLTIPGGLAALLTPLVAKLGPRLLTARVAVLVKPDGAGARVRAVNANDAITTDYLAAAAILALPPFIAHKITPALRERDKDLVLPQNSPWLVTAIKVDRWPKGFDPTVPFHRATDERASLIAHTGEPPEAVIVAHRPFPASATMPARMFLRDLDPDSARDWAFRELAPIFPDLPEIATKVELWRVGHGSVRPGPGWITKIAPKLREPLPPIHPCGADLAGIPCAESAITDGVRGAEAVLKQLGKLEKSWL